MVYNLHQTLDFLKFFALQCQATYSTLPLSSSLTRSTPSFSPCSLALHVHGVDPTWLHKDSLVPRSQVSLFLHHSWSISVNTLLDLLDHHVTLHLTLPHHKPRRTSKRLCCQSLITKRVGLHWFLKSPKLTTYTRA